VGPRFGTQSMCQPTMCHRDSWRKAPPKILTNRTGNFPWRTPARAHQGIGSLIATCTVPAVTGHPYVKGRVSNTNMGTFIYWINVLQFWINSLGLNVLIAQVRVRVEGRDQQTFDIKAASCERSLVDQMTRQIFSGDRVGHYLLWCYIILKADTQRVSTCGNLVDQLKLNDKPGVVRKLKVRLLLST